MCPLVFSAKEVTRDKTRPARLLLDNYPPPGTILFNSYGNGQSNLVSQTRAQWDSNAWYHVAITSDGSGNRCLYINGVCESSANGEPFGQNLPNFYIGALASYNTQYSPETSTTFVSTAGTLGAGGSATLHRK